MMDATGRLDGPALRLALSSAIRRRRPLDFLEGVAVPFLRAVGVAWRARRLDVRHEHFATACVADALRGLRRRLERGEGGPHVALGSLPGDRHELGTMMASVVFAESGWGVVYLGADTPVQQMLALARETPLAAVVIGVSGTAPAASRSDIRRLARELPPDTRLVVGGKGAPRGVSGAEVALSLTALARWAREFATTVM